jgi:hypothetical protein
MNPAQHSDIFEGIRHVEAHFAQAPYTFFQAWKRGVELVGPELFGDGTPQGLDAAVCKWDLRPNLADINQAIGPLSSGEKVFLAAMTSFYNAEKGGTLLKRVGVHGLADLGGLDLERRKVIATLILNYHGW